MSVDHLAMRCGVKLVTLNMAAFLSLLTVPVSLMGEPVVRQQLCQIVRKHWIWDQGVLFFTDPSTKPCNYKTWCFLFFLTLLFIITVQSINTYKHMPKDSEAKAGAACGSGEGDSPPNFGTMSLTFRDKSWQQMYVKNSTSITTLSYPKHCVNV